MRKEKEKQKKRKPTLNLIKPENSKKKMWSFGSETGLFWTRELQKEKVEEYMKKKEEDKMLKLNRKWYIKPEKENYQKHLTTATQPPLLPL